MISTDLSTKGGDFLGHVGICLTDIFGELPQGLGCV